MKIEQLNSVTDGHKELVAGGVKSSAIYSVANPGVSAYVSMGTRVATPAKMGTWDMPDTTTMTRTDGYSTAEKKPLLSCRH